VLGVVVAGVVVGMVVVVVVVVALAVGTSTGAVVVRAGVVAQVASSSYVLILPLACFLDLLFYLYVFPYP